VVTQKEEAVPNSPPDPDLEEWFERLPTPERADSVVSESFRRRDAYPFEV